MSVKDLTKHYGALNSGGAAVPTPNTVSRDLPPGERSFSAVVFESGKPVFDADLNLQGDAADYKAKLVSQWSSPSGWVRAQGTPTAALYTENVPTALQVVDVVDPALVTAGRTLFLNSFGLPRSEALVAGMPVVVEYTNCSVPDYNVLALQPPQIYDGTNATVKRTDFVFLEVWQALLAPSPRASGWITVVNAAQVNLGDTITIDGNVLTAVGVPAVNGFVPDPLSALNTAAAIAAAINDPGNAFSTTVVAVASLGTASVVIKALNPGANGNAITLVVNLVVPGCITLSGPTLLGGENRNNKPVSAQDKLYRQGNVQSLAATWLVDGINDPVIDREASQRIQVQYRIRATGTTEAVNYKKFPDGFSTTPGAGVAAICAQGATGAPVTNAGGRFYPFVPADGATVWGNSSAPAYGVLDDGLWVAGDGSDQAAKDLGSVDGFVYAIPMFFVFRHNNVSDPAAAIKGFDPVNNTNGAPSCTHGGYNGVLGGIPANTSDRPDAEFCDLIASSRILDLRRQVCLNGLDLQRELQYQTATLLSGDNYTWAVDTASKQTLGNASGDVSTTYLVCNEIGRLATAGGNPPFSGDTNRGVAVRNFDHIARRFSSYPVVERVVFAFYPGDRPDNVTQGGPQAPGLANLGKYVTKAENGLGVISPTQWYEGDSLHLNLTALNSTTLGGIFQGGDGGGPSGVGLPQPAIADMMPAGTVITDILSIFHDDGDYSIPVDQSVQASLIVGLGTPHVGIYLDGNDTSATGGVVAAAYRMVGRNDVLGNPVVDGSPRRIFVEFEITYPVGSGLTDLPLATALEPDAAIYNGGSGVGPGPLLENAVSQRPNDMEAMVPPFIGSSREAHLEYVANDTVSNAFGAQNAGAPIGSVNTEEVVSSTRLSLTTPRRIYGADPQANLMLVTDTVSGLNRVISLSDTEFGSSTRKLKLAAGQELSGLGHTLCAIQYFAQDPIPNYGVAGAGFQVSLYYRAQTPQTAGVKEGDITVDGCLPTTMIVEPLVVAENMWVGQASVGSVEEGYPYSFPLNQIPINDGSALAAGVSGTTAEWYFCATTEISISDFNANTGALNLHTLVPPLLMGSPLMLGGTTNEHIPRKDAEFRAFFPYVHARTGDNPPAAFAQPLSGSSRHKNFVSVLGRVVTDAKGPGGGILFRRNEVVLLLLSRFAELDSENSVRSGQMPIGADNRASAAIYRTRGLLLLNGIKP